MRAGEGVVEVVAAKLIGRGRGPAACWQGAGCIRAAKWTMNALRGS